MVTSFNFLFIRFNASKTDSPLELYSNPGILHSKSESTIVAKGNFEISGLEYSILINLILIFLPVSIIHPRNSKISSIIYLL